MLEQQRVEQKSVSRLAGHICVRYWYVLCLSGIVSQENISICTHFQASPRGLGTPYASWLKYFTVYFSTHHGHIISYDHARRPDSSWGPMCPILANSSDCHSLQHSLLATPRVYAPGMHGSTRHIGQGFVTSKCQHILK